MDVTPGMTLHYKRLCLAGRLSQETVVSGLMKEVAMLGSPCGRNCQWPLGAESSLQPTASKEPGPSVPQTQGNEFCPSLKETWKQILPQSSLQM